MPMSPIWIVLAVTSPVTATPPLSAVALEPKICASRLSESRLAPSASASATMQPERLIGLL